MIHVASLTLGGSAERLQAGCVSPATEETASSVYHVIKGTGFSRIGDQVVSWKQGDTFCIPAWHKYEHHANEEETVYFYRFDDKPMLKALGFYRRSDVDVESYVST